jgi:LysM repeat protein
VSLGNNAQEETTFLHTVERGQTIYAISLMYDVNEEAIYRLNPSSREYIKVGEKLKIPQKNVSNISLSEDKGEAPFVFHTIQPKETLYGVSKKFNVTGEQIIKANPGLSSQTFAAGKTIRIPQVIELPPTTEKKTVIKEIQYTIKKKETVYSICKSFNITSDKLMEYNPTLKKGGLKAGTVIIIPMEAEAIVTSTPEQNENEVNALITIPKVIKSVNAVKIALLLPFKISDAAASARHTEFYEGLLMAVDSMRNTGVTIEMSVYDIGEGVQKTKEILQKDELLRANLLIGGVSNEQIELIADFALKHEIKYVVPFSAKCDKLTSNNAYMFQVATPHQYLYSYVSTRACTLFSNYNIIFLNTNDKDEKTLYIQTFKADLSQRKLPFKQLNFKESTFQADLTALLSKDKPNLIVPLSGAKEALAKIKEPLRVMVDAKQANNLTLFGYPEWQVYANDYLKELFALNTYIYATFYANNLSSDVKRFNVKYRSFYKKEMMASYPKLGMLGYDTGMYFISAIVKYGSNFENDIQKIKYNSLQTGFNFQRVNNWGGFINTNLYYVQYQKDFTIKRIE